jgi:hypothetical protein
MNKTSKEKEAVLNVFAGIVKPLMPLAFEYGITAGEIAGVLRRSFIASLEARLLEQKRPTTDARLAAVAGLPRSDVSALRDALRAGAPHSMRASVSLDQITALLNVWHTHTNFSGAYGLASELDLVPVPGSPRRSFKELVAVACAGVDEDALLDELVAARSVEVIDGTTARCLSRAYVPQSADVMRIERMGRFVGAATASLVHNLSGEEPLYLEKTVVSDEALSESGRDKFLALAGERGQELLFELDTFLTRLAATERTDSGRKYGVGIYFFEEQAAGQQAAQEQQSRKTYETDSGKASAIQEIDVLAGFGRKE